MNEEGRFVLLIMMIAFVLMCTWHAGRVMWRKRTNRAHRDTVATPDTSSTTSQQP